jgi:hypothetical protein
MARALKHVDLMLSEDLIERLQGEAENRRIDLSELVGSLLSQNLGVKRDVRGTVERIRKLRKAAGPMSDSTAAIRESRDLKISILPYLPEELIGA